MGWRYYFAWDAVRAHKWALLLRLALIVLAVSMFGYGLGWWL